MKLGIVAGDDSSILLEKLVSILESEFDIVKNSERSQVDSGDCPKLPASRRRP